MHYTVHQLNLPRNFIWSGQAISGVRKHAQVIKSNMMKEKTAIQLHHTNNILFNQQKLANGRNAQF